MLQYNILTSPMTEMLTTQSNIMIHPGISGKMKMEFELVTINFMGTIGHNGI